MKRLLLLGISLAALTAAVDAQLVHLTLNGTVTDRFGGESWSPGGTGIGETATLHLFYDPTLPVSDADPAVPEATYAAHNRANNFWRLNYGAVAVSAAFDTLKVSDTEISVYAFELNSLTTLDLRLVFSADPSPAFALPVPPLPSLAAVHPMNPFDVNPSRFVFDTQNGFGLDAGSLYVDITSMQSEIVPRFRPVPEPATYGAAAGAILLAMIARKRLTRRPLPN